MEPIPITPFTPCAFGEHFARFLCDLAGSQDPSLLLAARCIDAAVRSGHVCVDLSRSINHALPLPVEHPENALIPDTGDWINALVNTSIVGAPGDYKPLILDGARLYLHRYWEYERALSEAILTRAQALLAPADPKLLASLVTKYIPNENEDNGQRLALLIAALKNFLVISGGPGAGKTTLVAKVVAMLLELSADAPCRIALTAPTGKAAARLVQSVQQAFGREEIPEALQARFPQESFTIHRLLGVNSRSSRYKYSAENPLPYDIIVVDEASMADLALMTKFMAAVPKHSKLILLGDKDQLASVEAGAVLGDICDGGTHGHTTPAFSLAITSVFTNVNLPADATAPPLSDCIVELTKNYRFKENSRMGAIALAIKKGDARESWNLLEKTDDPSMLLHDVPLAQSLQNALREVILLHYSPSCVESDPVIALESFNKFRVLCAIKNGPFGVIGINAIIERILSGEGLIRPISSWYAGRPVMIIANDYGLNLFNGDIGITLPDPSANNELKIFFKSSATGNIRSFSPHRLPPHETVYAMTIHKAQGSEFDHTVLVLPPVYTPVLSRELLYTGITRARQSCRIWSTKDIFMKSVENATERMSGLRDKLWKA